MSEKNFIQRNPRITIIIILFVFIIIVDSLAAVFFIPSYTSYSTFRTSHQYYNHTLLPYQYTKDEYIGDKKLTSAYTIKTNSLGFRDNSLRKIDLVTDKTRVLFIGDSFTEGVGMSFDKTFVGRLNNKFDNNKYEILNAGVASYSPKLYYLKIQFLLDYVKLHFNKLVVFIDISDVQDEIIYRDFEPRLNKKDFEISSLKLWLIKVKHFIRRHSYLYYSLSQLNFHNEKNNSNAPIEKITLLKNNMDLWNDFNQYANERGRWTFKDSIIYKKWGKLGLKLAEGYMNELHKLCRENNIEMAIGVYPWPDQIRVHDLNSIQVIFWKGFCEKQNIKFINLFPLFINNTPPEEVIKKYYFTGDIHWNEDGHKLVADSVYRELSKL